MELADLWRKRYEIEDNLEHNGGAVLATKR
jgi:hypothetical protein